MKVQSRGCELRGVFRSETAEEARAGLVLGFAAVPEAQIIEAVQTLRRAWKL